DGLIVVAQIRLAGVVAESPAKWPVTNRYGVAPGHPTIIGIVVSDLSKVSRLSSQVLVVVGNIDAACVFVDVDPRKPLRSIASWDSIEQDRSGKRQPTVYAPLKRDVSTITRIVIFVDKIHIASKRSRRSVHGEAGRRVDAVITQNLVYC